MSTTTNSEHALVCRTYFHRAIRFSKAKLFFCILLAERKNKMLLQEFRLLCNCNVKVKQISCNKTTADTIKMYMYMFGCVLVHVYLLYVHAAVCSFKDSIVKLIRRDNYVPELTIDTLFYFTCMPQALMVFPRRV